MLKVFGSVAGVSIGDLFLAGIGAGVVIGISSIIYIYFYSRYHKFPRDRCASMKELLVSTRKAIWASIIPIVILGGIYGGFFTPTEAAGVTVIYALIVSVFIYRVPGSVFKGILSCLCRIGQHLRKSSVGY